MCVGGGGRMVNCHMTLSPKHPYANSKEMSMFGFRPKNHHEFPNFNMEEEA